MKLEKLKPGMRVYSNGRDRSMLRRPASWPVVVVEVDLVKRRVFARWNYNAPQWFGERNASRWTAKPRGSSRFLLGAP